MENQVPAKIKKQRHKKLMTLQKKISREVNEGYVGKTLPCIVEGFTDDGLVLMRSQYDAPEIDGMVYANSNDAVVPGDIVNVKINRADDYDLFGEIVE